VLVKTGYPEELWRVRGAPPCPTRHARQRARTLRGRGQNAVATPDHTAASALICISCAVRPARTLPGALAARPPGHSTA